jgi:hypothetical protein
MHRFRISLFLGMLLWVASAPADSQQRSATVRVYKDPTCGCCEKWVEHLRAAGFVVTVLNAPDVTAIKDKQLVPKQARSCHTGSSTGTPLRATCRRRMSAASSQSVQPGRSVWQSPECRPAPRAWRCRAPRSTLRCAGVR